jgi:hypothetical protein
VEVYRCPSRPSESSVELLVPTRCRLGTSSRNWLLVQSSHPAGVSRLLVSRSRSAVDRFLGCAVFPRRAAPTTLSDRCTLSASFAFLQSLDQHVLADRPQPASSSHGLSFPSALEESEVHLREPCLGPLRSALRVWLPSRRLTPSEPVPAFFHAGSALGIRPSELSPPERYPPRFRADEPTCRFSRRYSRRRNGGPAQRTAASGLLPFRESLATAAGLVQRPLDAPLGFTLLGHPGKSLARDFARAPPARFAAPGLAAGYRRRLGVSIGSHLTAPAEPASRLDGHSNPCRVLAPA